MTAPGKHAWVPHGHDGVHTLRRPQARHRITTNEYAAMVQTTGRIGPLNHFIGWLTEYDVSLAPPPTPSSSAKYLLDEVAVYSLGFVEGCGTKGFVSFRLVACCLGYTSGWKKILL